MNTRPPEDRLSQLLHDRADRQSGRPIPMTEVTGRARVIRRRRRTAVAAAAAVAVAAIAVPTALLLQDGPPAVTPVHPSPTPTPTPTPTGTPAPTPTPTPTATSAPTTALRLAAVRAGESPRISYVTDHTVHLDGTSTTELPTRVQRVAAFTPYHGGWLVADDETARGYQLDNTGRVVRQVGGQLVISADGTQTAFATPGKVCVGTEMGQVETSYPVANPGGIVGFLSGARVVYVDGAGSVYVMGADSSPTLRALVGASDANQSADLVAGALDNSRGVEGVVSAKTGTVLWRTSTWRLLRFSPDGRYISATPARDNGDPEELAVLDAQTGRLVTSLRLTSRGLALLLDPAWESDTALLLGTEEQRTHREAVLRLGVDGSVDRATPVRNAPSDGTAYVFTARP